MIIDNVTHTAMIGQDIETGKYYVQVQCRVWEAKTLRVEKTFSTQERAAEHVRELLKNN